VTAAAPKRSDRLTTPAGTDIQALTTIGAASGPAVAGSGGTSSHISSVEPPPMSNMIAWRRDGSSSAEQPATASRASSPAPITSIASPVSRATRAGRHRRCRRAGTPRSRPRGRCRLVAAQLRGADLERRDGALDRGRAEPAGRFEAFAEPHDARERVDDLQAAGALLARDQQAAIVGPEVERGVDVRSRRPPPRRRPGCWDGSDRLVPARDLVLHACGYRRSARIAKL